MWSIGIDIGGTFTDIVVREAERTLARKVLTTHDDPVRGVAGNLVRNACAGPEGVTPQPVVGHGGTDTRFWRTRGVPAFVHGCSPAGMRTADESVSISEFHHVLHTHTLAAFDYLSGGTDKAVSKGTY